MSISRKKFHRHTPKVLYTYFTLIVFKTLTEHQTNLFLESETYSNHEKKSWFIKSLPLFYKRCDGSANVLVS